MRGGGNDGEFVLKWKQRYITAHRRWQDREAPAMVKDHGYLATNFPKVGTSNGLQTFIINYINWSGYRATRINVAGRLIDQPQRQESGIVLLTKKYMPSTTRRGTADVSSTIRINGIGASVMWEIKVGKDKASEAQLKEQEREQRAGGYYFFVKDPEQFFEIYDSLFVSST